MTTRRPAMLVALALLSVAGLSDSRGAAAQNPRGLLSVALFGCTIETRPLSFGIYNPLAAVAVDALGQVIYSCGVTLLGFPIRNIRIELSRGAANSYDRHMMSGAESLGYNVYLDASRRTVWGDGSLGTDYYFNASPPLNTPVTVPAYGRISAMQDVRAGTYTDNLQVTILF